MSVTRWGILLAMVGLAGACGGREAIRGVVEVDRGVVASATAEWYQDGERSLFAPRATGILIVTADQLRFLTYEEQSGEYQPALTLPRAGLRCAQRAGAVSKGELWCETAQRSFLFVSKEAGRIAGAFESP